MNLILPFRRLLFSLAFLAMLGHESSAALPVSEAQLREKLVRGQWTWDGHSRAYPPVPMDFRPDGTGGSERFTYEWTVTGPTTVTLKMENKGRQMEWYLTFNDDLTAFEARERSLGTASGTVRPVGNAVLPPSLPQPIARVTPAPSVAVALPATPPAPSAPVARPSTPVPLPPPIAAPPTPKPTPTPTPAPAPIAGVFYFYIDDTIQLFLNGRRIFQAQNRWFAGQTREVEVKPGDHLVAQLGNVGGARAFMIAFATADQKRVAHFSNTAFRVLANTMSTDFTPAEFQAGRMAEQDSRRKEKPPFWFRTRSEWVWGKTDVCTLGAIISADMFQPLQKEK